MTRALSAGNSSEAVARRSAAPGSYLQQSEQPWASLIFLLPLLVLYEVGTRQLLSPAHAGEQRIIAFTLMQRFFAWFGVGGRSLPAVALAAILLAWHVARRDGWSVRFSTVAGMYCEAAMLAVPLLGLGFLGARYHVLFATHQETSGLIVLSIGAGIYEEAVFRLGAFTALHFLLVDVLRIKKAAGYLLIVLLSSVMFAAYHYLGNEQFRWETFAFRTAAGTYFAIIFLFRGFGVTAGSHIAYDILIVLLRRVLH